LRRCRSIGFGAIRASACLRRDADRERGATFAELQQRAAPQ
jgi:hypothetical protein